MKTGKVWLVGAGPGDPGLLTLRGQKALEQAEVVVYDRLVGPGILCRIPQEAEAIDVGKIAGNHPVPQEQINEILLEKALEGRRVVRLKGGDPFVFGRGGEELALLAACGVPFEVVPGVTSALAVPAWAGIPATHRGIASSFHVITGHTRKGEGPELDFPTLARLPGTLVFLMGLSALETICGGLLEAGMPPETPAAVVEQGTTAHQREVVSALKDLPGAVRQKGIGSPAVIIVGGVSSLAEKFSWAEVRPLGGVRVLVTRPARSASVLAARLEELGAEVIALSAIETRLLPERPALDGALADLSAFSWLAVTSPAGAHHLKEALFAAGKDFRALAPLKIAAVGPGTQAALAEMGLLCDLAPKSYSGEALGRALSGTSGKILLARAQGADPRLPELLREQGRDFADCPLYRTEYRLAGAVSPLEFLNGPRDYAAFTSASTVRGFLAQSGGADVSKVKALCIGEQTATAAKAAGMEAFTAKEATLDAMVEKLLEIEWEN